MDKISPRARHKARSLAVQALYQWQFNCASPAEIEAEFFAEPDQMKKVDTLYFSELVRNVSQQQPEIDALLTTVSDLPVTDLTPIELTVLRIAIYELKNRIDIPYRVVINEALELTKKFGTQEGFKFVNGVLDRLARKFRKLEI